MLSELGLLVDMEIIFSFYSEAGTCDQMFLPSGHLAPLSVQSQRIPFGHKMYTLLETSTKLGTIVNFNLVGGLHGGIIS